MSRLVLPDEAFAQVADRLGRAAMAAVCAELGAHPPVSFDVRLRMNVRGRADTERLGGGAARMDWCEAWAAPLPGACVVEQTAITGLPGRFPAVLRVPTLDDALALVGHDGAEIGRARSLGRRLLAAGGSVTPSALRRLSRLNEVDAEVFIEATTWLTAHSDISAYTARQLPVPGMHTKWPERHASLLRAATGRDLAAELRPRPTVVHLTYLDPGYLASGARRHDSWTSGDRHSLPPGYPLEIVLIVENRDSRLWFPPVPGAVVVENNGSAAARHIPEIPWILKAPVVVYWGDIDQEGFTILDSLRYELRRRGTVLHSMLMDQPTFVRYERFGVAHDKDGKTIPGRARPLRNLTPDERPAYEQVSTGGDARVRRIEQENIPLVEAQETLLGTLPVWRRRGTECAVVGLPDS